uniref:uncharacterized protein isoform X2 n=1 Tax=Myxine glutinosa TaxID=7769 RepID=UPI00358FE8D4
MKGHVTNKDQQPMRGNMVVPRASVEPGSSVGEHEDKDTIPDYIVQVKVESDLMDDWSSQGEDFNRKLNVVPELVEYLIKGEAYPVKTENFQSNLLQTSQDVLSKGQIKEEVCDSYPTELNNAGPLIKERPRRVCVTLSKSKSTSSRKSANIFVKICKEGKEVETVDGQVDSFSNLMRMNLRKQEKVIPAGLEVCSVPAPSQQDKEPKKKMAAAERQRAYRQ